MEGSVLSFLKAEWKVSDTGPAHWASSLHFIVQNKKNFNARVIFTQAKTKERTHINKIRNLTIYIYLGCFKPTYIVPMQLLINEYWFFTLVSGNIMSINVSSFLGHAWLLSYEVLPTCICIIITFLLTVFWLKELLPFFT